jgi:hypothetical protein
MHVEGFSDGVFFDNRVSGSVSDVDCTARCSSGIHIGNSCSDITLTDITVATAGNVVRNDCSGKNVMPPARGLFCTLALYVQSNFGGNPAHATYWDLWQWIMD